MPDPGLFPTHGEGITNGLMVDRLGNQSHRPGLGPVLALTLWLAALVLPAQAESYVVKRNDTLSRIARDHGLSTSTLARANGIALDEIIRPGQRLTIPDSGPLLPDKDPDRFVIVRKNDSLSLIARRQGVDVNDLANANGLSLKETIHPGQRLVIPSGPVAAPPPDLDATVQRAIERAPVKPGRWKYIIIHHSATSEATVKGMDEYHRRQRHMENGLAYHFVIGNGHGMKDGDVAVGNRWTKQLQGGHVSGEKLNDISLGICLVGNFEKAAPTRKQLDSLDALLESLLTRCKLTTSSIKTHSQINPAHTRCPGKRFDIQGVIRRVST